MRIYTDLMEHDEVPAKYWMLYADVECDKCGKDQSFSAYKSNGSECVKCGAKISV